MDYQLVRLCQQQQLLQHEFLRPDCVITKQKNGLIIDRILCEDKSQGAENRASQDAKQCYNDDEFENDTHLLDVIDFTNLFESMEKCKHDVLFKKSVARFYLNGLEECLKLEKQLKENTYKEYPPYSFIVTHPKVRQIVSITFRDRVYQRSLNDNSIYPKMVKPFIWSNFACQRGKGTDLARNSFKEYLRHHYRKDGLQGGILKWDIKGYYDNLTKQTVLDVFRKYLDDISYERAKTILLHQYKNIKGFNPGSQIVQIAGVATLNKLDHYIKEQLRIKGYFRYMDDGLLVHQSTERLEECKEKISEFLKPFGLQLNAKKTRVYSLAEGIEFLGFIYRLTKTGKVVATLTTKNIKFEKKKLVRLVNLAKKGKLSKEKVSECYKSWKAHACKGDTHRLLRRMDLYYNNLWRVDNDLPKEQR